MESVSRFVSQKLRLKVNQDKSAISYPWWRRYLGFSFTSPRGNTRVRIHSKTIKRFKNRVRELTCRRSGRSIKQIIESLNRFLKGWWNYYSLAETRSGFRSINGWVIRRLRAILWKHWKNPRTRVRKLKKRGVWHQKAVTTGNARKGCWRMSRVKWVIIALPNAYFTETLGLFLPGT